MIQGNRIYQLSSYIEFSKFSDREYLLYNSLLNKYTKINQKYYDLLILVDGNRTISEIRDVFQYKTNILLSNAEIILLFNKLAKYGVFGDDETVEKAKKIPSYIKFGSIILNSKIVSKIVPYFSFIFNKYFLFAVFFVSILGFSYSIYYNYTKYLGLNMIQILPYFIGLSLISTILHEIGHASAAHYYKAKHGGIGFGFYMFFFPAFFADVTDVWRLDKWKRIMVNMAGIYFELIFCLFLIIIGLFANYQNIQIIALMIAFSSLYNLIPFLRADGYWILSDVFDKPNLNFHALNNLKLIIHSLFRKKKLSLRRNDYCVALYGIFNIILFIFFFYTQLFYNWNLIINFPVVLWDVIISIFKGKFNINFNDLLKLMSILLFYIIVFKIIVGVVKRKINQQRLNIQKSKG